jgi:hypothetical protein
MLSYILAAAQLIYVKTFMKNKTGKTHQKTCGKNRKRPRNLRINRKEKLKNI